MHARCEGEWWRPPSYNLLHSPSHISHVVPDWRQEDDRRRTAGGEAADQISRVVHQQSAADRAAASARALVEMTGAHVRHSHNLVAIVCGRIVHVCFF